MENDPQLVKLASKGDLRAFKHLVQQHEKLVFHVVRRMVGQQEDVEDLCQEVFIKVHKKLPQFKGDSKVSTWIASIAFNTTVNYLKKKRIPTTGLSESEFLENAELSAEASMIQQDQQAFIQQQVNRLPAQYKAILTLYHLEEMSYKEIGVITKLPEGTVKNYLFRARKLLKEQLTRHVNRNAKWDEKII